jgi:hypothetical protein
MRHGQVATEDLTYAQLFQRILEADIDEKEVDVRNKLSQVKFTSALLLQCLTATVSWQLHLD